MELNSFSVHKHAKKELDQHPAILTSHLVNNPYIQLNIDIITYGHSRLALLTKSLSVTRWLEIGGGERALFDVTLKNSNI